MARTFQNIELFENLTVIDNLMLGRAHAVHVRDARRRLLARAPPGSSELADRAAVEDIVDFLELAQYRGFPVGLLPYGVQKRVELGRALAMQPKLLLLDEPVAGMNLEETEDMARFILDIRDELKIPMIMVEHDMGLVMDLADRVMVVDFGVPITTGVPAEVQKQPRRHQGLPRPGPRHRRPAQQGEHGRGSRPGTGSTGRERVMTATEARTETRPTATTTVVTRIRDRAAATPTDVAMRSKDFGLWQETSWARVLGRDPGRRATRCSPSASQRGDRVAIQSENRKEWLTVDLGAVAIGAATVGIYPTNPAAEVVHLLSDSAAKVLLSEDQEQVDKALEVSDRTPDLQTIVYVEPRGIRGRYDDGRLLFWEDSSTRGREHRAAHPGAVEDAMAQTRPEDLMTLIYTSGTTGLPKGAMLSVANVEATIEALTGPGLVEPPAGPEGPGAVLPAAQPRRRAHLHDLEQRRHRHPGQLRRVDRDRAGEPARDPADLLLRGAAHLGEAAGHRPGEAGRGQPAQGGDRPGRAEDGARRGGRPSPRTAGSTPAPRG